MTQCEKIVDFIRSRGGSATLGELLDAGRFDWAHKLTARISDLRARGINIICQKGDTPTKNLYILKEESKSQYPQPQYSYDEFSQGAFL